MRVISDGDKHGQKRTGRDRKIKRGLQANAGRGERMRWASARPDGISAIHFLTRMADRS